MENQVQLFSKLLELQQDYLQRVFDEDPLHSQVLQEYIELVIKFYIHFISHNCQFNCIF